MDVRVVVKSAGYATFEVAAIDSGGLDVRNVIWGPLITYIVGTVGGLVGVVSNPNFALGMFGVNAKTVSGWPEEYISLSYRNDLAVANSELQRNRRNNYVMSAAATTTFGSVVQAYTRDYSIERVFKPGVGGWTSIPNLERVPALTGSTAHYGSLVPAGRCEGAPTGCSGSKVVVFGVARDRDEPAPGTELALLRREVLDRQVLGRIGAIEVGEGMPHPIVEGAWNKISEASIYPYFIIHDLAPANMAGTTRMAEELGFAALYKNAAWGVINPGDFSISSEWHNSSSTMKDKIDRLASDHKIGFGTHTLSMWPQRVGPVSSNDRDGLNYRADAHLAASFSLGG